MRLRVFASRAAASLAIAAAAGLNAGCTTTAVLLYAYDKATEGAPTPCHKLNSVERALTERCGSFQADSLQPKDVLASGLPQCPLALAARDPQFWPVLPELLAKGAQPEACAQSPLVALAQAQPCPDFSAATAPSLQALRWLAEADTRAIHHDVVRLLSCPAAQTAGLTGVLDDWLAQGLLPRQSLAFSPLGALHPSYLNSRLSLTLEAHGHNARDALGAYAGQLPSGFDAALHGGQWAALDWWLDRVPELANRVPPTQGNQFPWLPLARVITPSYMSDVDQQRALVQYLIARGADPAHRLPHDPGQTVASYARQLHSPLLPLLEAPAPQRLARGGTRLSAAAGAAVVASPATRVLARP